jgi:bacillithiol system protein YtxJ
MVGELRQEHDLELLLERSKTNPVLIFKHSTQCAISDEAHNEFINFAEETENLESTVVLVIENRRLSNAIEQRFGIRHESPQALLIKDGRVVWHASHWNITSESLNNALKSYAESTHQRN